MDRQIERERAKQQIIKIPSIFHHCSKCSTQMVDSERSISVQIWGAGRSSRRKIVYFDFYRNANVSSASSSSLSVSSSDSSWAPPPIFNHMLEIPLCPNYVFSILLLLIKKILLISIVSKPFVKTGRPNAVRFRFVCVRVSTNKHRTGVRVRKRVFLINWELSIKLPIATQYTHTHSFIQSVFNATRGTATSKYVGRTVMMMVADLRAATQTHVCQIL